jgi:hypothetical protein
MLQASHISVFVRKGTYNDGHVFTHVCVYIQTSPGNLFLLHAYVPSLGIFKLPLITSTRRIHVKHQSCVFSLISAY